MKPAPSSSLPAHTHLPHLRRGAGLTAAAALFLMTAWAATPAEAAPNLRLIGVQVDDTVTGNGDGEMEPGETVDLKLKLWNDGTTAATSIFGTLTVDNPDVTILDGFASWPNLVAMGAPALTDAPHFRISLPSAMACGRIVALNLGVLTAEGGFTFNYPLKVGQRIDHDMMHDPIRRFTEQEANFWGAPSDQLLDTATGDVNGDGFDDVIIGGPDSTHGGSRPGAGVVYLIYGGADRWADSDLAVPPAGVVRFWGAEQGDGFASVGSGDVNGDGFDDVILGVEYAHSVGNSRLYSGEVYLIYGKATPWTDTDLLIPPVGVALFSGAEQDDALGVSVGSGDINGDGFDDMILGATRSSSFGNTRDNGGEVYLVYGKAAPWTDTDLASPPAGVARFWGPEIDGFFGHDVDSGDVDGDGFDDLILSGFSSGEVHLIYGRSTQWTDTDLLSPPGGVVQFSDSNVNSPLAVSVTTGDINGDGFDDLILGAPSSSSIGAQRAGAGEVYLVYGRAIPWTDTNLEGPSAGIVRFFGVDKDDTTVVPFNNGDNLGFRVASGDTNGDGFDELILGAWRADSAGNARTNAGEVYLIYGKATSWSHTDLANPPSGVIRFLGDDAEDYLGTGVATGDVDGDAFDDLILGAWNAYSIGDTRPASGEVYLWYGKPTDTYVVREESPSYLNTSGSTVLPLSCDDCHAVVVLPFVFPYYAEDFSRIYVSSNGFLSFEPIVDAGSHIPSCMPAGGVHDMMIAPLWTNLDPSVGPPGSGVYTKVDGTYPYRRFTIEWRDIPHYPLIGAATFEVTLFETTGQVLFQYNDLSFGNPAHDFGASAVVGVENRTGAHGVPYSCNVNNLLAQAKAVRFYPTTTLVVERAEHGEGLWTAPPGTGSLWHFESALCGPNFHSGATSWYYGDPGPCDNVVNNEGPLRMPTVPDFPADSRLSFWSRHQSEPGFDFADVQLSTTGTSGLYSDIVSVTDSTNAWRYGGVTDLFSNAGDTVDLQFHFSSDASISYLGWMVDDIQLTGCDAQDVATSAAHAAIYGDPTTYCEGSTFTLDALGSFCGDSGAPSSYQWLENGVSIPGAAGVSYTIPSTHPAGVYDFQVAIGCPGGASALSAPLAITIEVVPGPVGRTLDVVPLNSYADLHFTWTEIPSASLYAVVQDSNPNGLFGLLTGMAPSGTIGLTVPMPREDVLYFLVAGANSCGIGPTD